MGPIELLEPPSERIVSLAAVKAHLRVDHSEEDELIEAYMVAAEQRLEGLYGITGRAFRPQRYRVSFGRFGPSLCLPFPPTISVDALTYLDNNGDEQSFAQAGNWRVIGIGSPRGAVIVPEDGVSWPSLYATPDPDLVRVEFTAGYQSATSPGDDLVPAQIKHAVKMIVADWYEHRTSSVIGTSAAELPHGVENLIAPLRVARAYLAA